ncbi:hypothetical protein Lser_V15G02857 [Lactuca serriola]
MRKPLGHKEKYSNRYEISHNHSIDGTSARTRPYSFDEIMLRRKNKKLSVNVEDQRLASEIVYPKEAESVSGRVESDRHRQRDEQPAPNEPLTVSSRTKENKSMREDLKRVEGEHKESGDLQRRSKAGNDNTKDRRKERGVHDFGNEHEKRHGKDSGVKERDRNVERNRGKSEHVNRLNQNGYDERGRDKKLESRKRHEREKRRSNSPSPKGNKPRLHDVKDHEELLSSSHSSKAGRFDPNLDRKRVSNNGLINKPKRHDSSVSRLGGYSPRKRRNEAPSPTDSSPVKIESKTPNSLTSFLPNLMSLNKIELPNMVPLTPSVPIPKPTFGVLSFPSLMNTSVDSVQLTQATRPKRRIYVENLPSSASEAAVVEWLSGYLRPYGLNHLQSTNPCISCIVNKDKCQALVEFLTPEDASTALSFDGRSFNGNILKIRRPKDYVEATTGVLEKKQPVAVAGGVFSVKNIVQDSSNKIFIGGISKVITSQMIMEIASAFGPLKAFHFEHNSDLDTTPCAFLEYVDQSVTIKACVGLNGMKLGGQLLTVTQATPDNTSSMEKNHGDNDHPFYGTPAHAQPLLQKQTQVLKLNNLVDPQSLSSLSEQEFDEIVEDVRLECSRFGMVKSVNIVKPTKVLSTSSDKEPPPEDVAAPTGGGDGGGAVVEERFEGGCVLVEYKRIEASTMAAHCLHGRVFDGRIVSVEYVGHDVYCDRFEK